MLCLLGAALAQDYSWSGGPGRVDPVDICLIDKSSCGCCLMRRVMSRMEMMFNRTHAELQDHLQKSQNAILHRLTSRSAFSAAFSDTPICVGPYRQDVTIRYRHIFVNLNDRYNNSTGVFTAPRSGVYNLALTAYNDAGAGGRLAICIRLSINGVQQASLMESNLHDREDSTSVNLAVSLLAGDRVSVTLIAGCYLCDDSRHRNIFSGFLLFD
ncbi:hypothetical protein ACEWY4_008749 [Coilia grayii]|uniref:C1q domain-containing protein n=1 Tax=Coilia grayii TaxID=363190 RepID=A0ABD1KC65_9TELE